MNTIASLIILIVIGLICAYVHRSKGYSPVTGFLWGFFFSIIGLLIILFERNKEEQVKADKNGLTMYHWLAIFLGAGFLMILIFAILI